ncbi:MAG: hypothetical protein J6X18_05145 [Bacteroidales bacterium]|nr:hypothetical protein [Bacteroidales bacterium]
MVYQIDENTLRKIVKECVVEVEKNKDFEDVYQKVLSRNKRRFSEMTMFRNKYIYEVDKFASKILEKICFIRYSVLTGDTKNKLRWCRELEKCMKSIMQWELKGSKNYATKEDIIREVWDWYDFVLDKSIRHVIEIGLIWEEFEIEEDMYSKIISDCISTYDRLIPILSSGTHRDVRKFITSICK